MDRSTTGRVTYPVVKKCGKRKIYVAGIEQIFVAGVLEIQQQIKVSVDCYQLIFLLW